MAGTVSGTYELVAGPALTSLDRLRSSARTTQTAMFSLGNQVDKTISHRAVQRIDTYTGRLRTMANTANSANARVRESFRVTQMSVSSSLSKVDKDIDGTLARLKILGGITAAPEVKLKGTEVMRAEIRALRAELRALNRDMVNVRAPRGIPGLPGGGGGGIRGPAGGFPGGGGGGGRGASIGVGSAGINMMGMGLKTLAAAAAVALPAVQALAGAVTALAASAGAAALGAGAIGVAGVSALGVGLGTIVAVAAPLRTSISEAAKALTGYEDAQKAVTAGGRAHAQMTYQVQQAEQALSNSQIGAMRAQTALTQARRDARRELTDLGMAARGAALGERGAALTLARARDNLTKTAQDPMASVTDRADATLAVDTARFGVQQAKLTRSRAVVDRNRGRSRGVEKAPNVISAKDSARTSQQAVASAAHQLREARTQLTEGTDTVTAAKKALDEALAKAPKGTIHLIRTARSFGREWRKATRDSQGNLLSFLQSGVDTGRKMIPTLSRAAATSTGAVRREGKKLLTWASGPMMKEFLGIGSRMFSENLTQGSRFFRGFGKAIMNVTKASRPFLLEFSRGLADMATGWGRNTSNIGRLRKTIGGLVDHTRAWWRLTKALGRVLGTLFSAGAPSGKGMVQDLTGTLNRWDSWMKRNPVKVRKFFTDAAEGAKSIAIALVNVVGALNHIATALQPLLSGFATLTKMLGPLAGLLAPVLGAGAAAFGAAPLAVGGALLAARRGRGGRGGTGGAGGGSGGGGGGIRGMGAAALGGVAGLAWAGNAGGAGGVARTAGGMAKGGVRAAGKFLWPVAAISAGLTAASTKGTLGERAQAAASGATFGLIPGATTRAQAREQGERRAEDTIGKMADPGTLGGLEARAARLRGLANKAGAASEKDGPSFLGIGLRGALVGGPQDKERTRQGAAERGYRAELARTRAAIKAVRADQAAMMNARSRTTATTRMGEFKEGFTNISKRSGPVEAAKQTVNKVMEQMGKMKRAGARSLADQGLEWLNTARKQNPKLAGVYEDMRKRVVARYKRMKIDIAVVNGQILDGSRGQWASISESLSSAARRGVDKTGAEFQRLRASALAAMELMGLSPSQSSGILKNLGAKGASGDAARAVTRHRSATPYSHQYLDKAAKGARGMRIRGSGKRDTVPVAPGHLAAPGELIVNRHTERRVDRKLKRAGTTLGREVAGETRKHDASPALERARRGERIKMHAKGGRIVPIPGQPGESIHSGILPSLMKLIGEYDLKVTDGWAPTNTHAANSDHHWGGAVDLVPAGGQYGKDAGNWEKIDRLAAWAEPKQNAPRSPFRWVGYNGDPNHGRGHHLHLSWQRGHFGLPSGMSGGGSGGGTGGGGGADSVQQIAALRSRASGLQGLPGLLADRAAVGYAKGLTGQVNKALRGGGGGSSGSSYSGKLDRVFPRHIGPKRGAARLSPDQIVEIAQGSGLPGRAFEQIAHGESDYYPGIQQPDPGDGMVGYGLWQMTPNAWGKGSAAYKKMMGLGGIPAMFNPVKNAEMASFLYKAAGNKTSPWYGTKYLTGKAKGGRIEDWGGWNAKGGSFTTKPGQPALFGAGERGVEDVTIRPRGGVPKLSIPGGGRGGVNVTMTFGDVTVKDVAELKDVLDKAAEYAAEKILEALDRPAAPHAGVHG